MQPPETRAVWRAVVILVVCSAARAGWAARAERGGEEEPGVLPELLATSREAAAEEARRARPLEDEERLDPNRDPETELDRLPGVGPATARAIVAAREGGAVFRVPEDLLVVPGIGPATLARIRPWLDLSRPPPPGLPASLSRPQPSPAAGSRAVVDLNRDDVVALQSLPGIGPALAERIVEARKEQMFTSLDDLVRVRGIGEATVERLRPWASVGPTP